MHQPTILYKPIHTHIHTLTYTHICCYTSLHLSKPQQTKVFHSHRDLALWGSGQFLGFVGLMLNCTLLICAYVFRVCYHLCKKGLRLNRVTQVNAPSGSLALLPQLAPQPTVEKKRRWKRIEGRGEAGSRAAEERIREG